MNKKCKLNMPLFLTIFLLMSWANSITAQNGNEERYNLAVYATGTQNDQPLSASLQTVVQNKTITKLTGEGNYRLIERSNEFLRQIQNEQTMQQSGDVADGQIAEIGAGYGAQKICVVSVTIIDKYLYIATRIVDVATKTSFESGDAEVSNYKDIPVLTKTLEISLDKMLAVAARTNTPAALPTKPAQPTESLKPTKVSTTTPDQPELPQISDNNSSRQNDMLTVAEAKAEKAIAKAEAKAEKNAAKSEFDAGFKAYKERVIKEKGGFLVVNSLAYKEYRKWKANMISGSILLPVGVPLIISGLMLDSEGDFFDNCPDDWYSLIWISGVAVTTVGIIQLCAMNSHLKKSYKYYLNGDQHSASLQFYPYYGGNNTFGAGLSLRF